MTLCSPSDPKHTAKQLKVMHGNVLHAAVKQLQDTPPQAHLLHPESAAVVPINAVALEHRSHQPAAHHAVSLLLRQNVLVGAGLADAAEVKP